MKEHIVVLVLCSIQFIQVFCNKNVVLMIADDFRSLIYFSLTCKIKSLFRPNIGVYEESNSFSSPGMKTPNLDYLASKSLVLTNAYTQVTWLVIFTFWFKSFNAKVALCGPSRSSFLTGRRPDTIRCYDNHHLFRKNLPNTISMPQYFKENGYATLGAGKIFHPGMPDHDKQDDYPASWTEKVFHTATTDIKNVSWWSYTEEELEDVTLRDVANTDHFIKNLKRDIT